MKYGWPLHSADPDTAIYRLSHAGQTGVKPRGSKVSIRPVLSWKLEQSNCPLVHFNYGLKQRKSTSPVSGPCHQSLVGQGGWGCYGWKIRLCMLQCTGHKSKLPIYVTKTLSQETCFTLFTLFMKKSFLCHLKDVNNLQRNANAVYLCIL